MLKSLPSAIITIPESVSDGDNRDATLATLKLMRNLVRQYKKDARIRLFAADLVKNIRGKKFMSEIETVFEYVQRSIRYTQDINGIETIQTPDVTLELGYGDCDDVSLLICCLLEAIGHGTRFVAAGFSPETPNFFEHVWAQAYCPGHGRGGSNWLSLDATENRDIGWEPDDIATWIKVTN